MDYTYRDIKKGPTYASVMRTQSILGRVGWPLFAATLIYMFAFRPSSAVLALWIPVFICLPLSTVAVGLSNSMFMDYTNSAKREDDAGYTTAWTAKSPDFIPDVDLVDERTGIVLRLANHPELTKAEYLQKLEEIRDQPSRIKS